MPETFHTSSREWSRDVTMRTYTPMLAADVAALYTMAQYVEQLGARAPRAFVHEASASTPFFFGSHPIQYIQVAGRAVAPVQRGAFPQCTFEVHDGLSEQRCSCVFNEPAPVREGDLVCVLGEVSYFHEPQVRVHQIRWVRDSLAHEFMFKQEALDVRRFVLEPPVDALKPHAAQWAHVPGRPVLTELVRGLDAPPPAFARLRQSLEAKARAWGFAHMRAHAARARSDAT